MLRHATSYITKYCYIIFFAVLALAGGCALLSTQVKINHDIYSYMPADSETSQGLAIMNDEFDYNSSSSYQIMLADLTDEQKVEAKDFIASVPHVKSVSHDNSDKYNKDNYALYGIVYDVPADSKEANETYQTIHSHFKDSGVEIYESGQISDNNGSVIKPLVVAMSIACAMIILTIMSESYIEPWLYLFAIMVAVLLNKGTNVIFPNISFVTDSISMILQMALSMDYAIMLSNRYRQEKLKPDHPDKRIAMDRALRHSFDAISSSSITTVVGLLVLIFMSFTIGRDMGLVLSKGVILSLFSIFTVLPALLLFFDKFIEKSKKKTPHLKMDWFGNQSFRFRKIALPIFLLIFGGAFLLKGNTNILYTSAENNQIKDVFPTLNQTAVVYDNSEEARAAKLCADFATNPEVDRILCYSNTINEPEKYDQIVGKVNSLGNINVAGAGAAHVETVSADDYLVKVLYYYYFREQNQPTLSLPEFVTFVQTEVIPNQQFKDDITDETAANVERLSNFVIPAKFNRPRSAAELASLLGIKSSDMNDLLTLYYAKHPHDVRLTLNQFANFVSNEILTDPQYAQLVSREQANQLAKLLIFSNPNITNAKMNATELANLFGLSTNQVEQLFIYYRYTTTAQPTITATPAELINFALNNQAVLDELGISAADSEKLKTAIATVKANSAEIEADLSERFENAIAQLPEDQQTAARAKVTELTTQIKTQTETVLSTKYSYNDYANLVKQLQVIAETAKTKAEALNEEYNLGLDLSNLPTIDPEPYLAKLAAVYKLYEAESQVSITKMTPAEFINFLLAHQNDTKLKGTLTPERLQLLQLAKYVIDHQSTRYSATELAQAFNLNLESLRLVYALYDYRHVSRDPNLSIKSFINFIVNDVLTDPEYSKRFSADQKTTIYQVADLIASAEAGTQYSSTALYRKLASFSRDANQDQLFLVYLYYGSLYDYDSNWQITIEQFVDYLNAKILPDSRFASRIDRDTHDKIIDGKTKIHDAKKLLVGPKHSRILIETYLPSEGEDTFNFLQSAKEYLGSDGAKHWYFFIGDSAMAYEMSQSFSSEMNNITILTMITIFVVVAITFKSILIPAILVLVIQSAVYINMSYLSLTGQSIFYLALIIVQAILMGATIDYAILYTSYYIENRRYYQYDVKRALIESYNKSIHAILTSASILIIVTAIVGNFATAIAAKICQSISGGTLCATLITLLILPALLATLDRFIIKRKQNS